MRLVDKQKWPVLFSSLALSLQIPVILSYLVGFGCLLLPWGHPLISGDWPFNSDFLNFWSAARLTVEGKIDTVFDFHTFLNAQQALLGHATKFANSWGYPPHILLWLLGFGLLPYVFAFMAWTMLTFGLYVFAAAYKRVQPWGLTLILATAPASFANIIDGQNGFLTAACLVGGLRLLEKRPVLAGLLFGFLTFKPQLMVLLPFVLLPGRHWRACVAAFVTTAFLVGISVALWGTQPWQDYIQKTLPYQTALFETMPDAQHDNLTVSFVTWFMAIRLLGGSLLVAYSASIVAALVAIMSVLYTFRRTTSPDLRQAVMLTAVFLATPYAHVYDMPMLAAAIVAMLAAAKPETFPLSWLVLIIAVWLLPLFIYSLNHAGLPIAPLLIVGLLAMQLCQIKRTQNVQTCE